MHLVSNKLFNQEPAQAYFLPPLYTRLVCVRYEIYKNSHLIYLFRNENDFWFQLAKFKDKINVGLS